MEHRELVAPEAAGEVALAERDRLISEGVDPSELVAMVASLTRRTGRPMA